MGSRFNIIIHVLFIKSAFCSDIMPKVMQMGEEQPCSTSEQIRHEEENEALDKQLWYWADINRDEVGFFFIVFFVVCIIFIRDGEFTGNRWVFSGSFTIHHQLDELLTLTLFQVNSWMLNKPDGTYLVRNSSDDKKNYTLTLRKDGVNKLIKIYQKNSRFGFSLNEVGLHFIAALAIIYFC